MLESSSASSYAIYDIVIRWNPRGGRNVTSLESSLIVSELSEDESEYNIDQCMDGRDLFKTFTPPLRISSQQQYRLRLNYTHSETINLDLQSVVVGAVSNRTVYRLSHDGAHIEVLIGQFFSHEPTIADIVQVKSYFRRLSVPLPNELVEEIIDMASYWAHSSVTLEYGAMEIKQWGDEMVLRTPPLAVCGTEGDIVWDFCTSNFLEIGGKPSVESTPVGIKPFRKIEFQLSSCDQGWATHALGGSYDGSYTWFDVSVERLRSDTFPMEKIKWPYDLFTARLEPPLSEMDCPFSEEYRITPLIPMEGGGSFQFSPKEAGRPPNPGPYILQQNIVARETITRHIITWTDFEDVVGEGQGSRSHDGTFVRDLQVGDSVTLWARTRYPGWTMTVEKVKVTVYWMV